MIQIRGENKLLLESEISTINNFVTNGCTIDEWNDFCDSVKFDSERDGKYPKDWFEQVILTGKINKIINSQYYINSKNDFHSKTIETIRQQKEKRN